MNVKRFLAKTSREALLLVKQKFGDDAVVLATKPASQGVEVLAMGPDSILHIEQMSASAPLTEPGELPRADDAPAADAARLSMSTLSFQDYVRERMLRRRQAALRKEEPALPTHEPPSPQSLPSPGPKTLPTPHEPICAVTESAQSSPQAPLSPYPKTPPTLYQPIRVATELPSPADARREIDLIHELRSMKGLIEERFGALAFMDRLQRSPQQAMLARTLLDAGFSPPLVRKLVDNLPADAADEHAWAAGVLERNLSTNEHEGAIEDQGGVHALIGATGVGKTTSTAKIAAAFAARHGAANLGLVTLDAYRVAAHEQLRAYGRILGVPVHTAHDRATLEDLLDLLSGKKLVLIDTAGIGQRDTRTRELLGMLGSRSIARLLVVNAASQGETIEDVMQAYRARECAGLIVSKMDEAMRLGPALDAAIRHRVKVVGVANGQRVPEDWHRLSAKALVHRAVKPAPCAAFRMQESDVRLVFAGAPRAVAAA